MTCKKRTVGSNSKMLWQMFMILTVTSGCQGRNYSGQYFTFPSDIPAHETGWTYRCEVRVSTTASGSMFRQSAKHVRVTVVDADERELYEDEYEFSAVSGIKANVDWSVGSTVTIALIEYGNENVSDEYSQSLAMAGERTLKIIHLRMDNATGMFAAALEQ